MNIERDTVKLLSRDALLTHTERAEKYHNARRIFCKRWFMPGDAAMHDALRKVYVSLYGNILMNQEPEPVDLSAWTALLINLYAEEQPRYNAVNTHCENMMSLAHGWGYQHRLKWYHLLFKHVCRFTNSRFPPEV